MQLTDNFKLEEFVESRFYDSEIQKKVWETFERFKMTLLPNARKLAEHIQPIRDYTCATINVHIAFRPFFWEIMQGRSGNSFHTMMMAADISSSILTPLELKEVAEFLIEEEVITQGGIGLYNWGIHIDNRGVKARW